jgi:hypothetical protein
MGSYILVDWGSRYFLNVVAKPRAWHDQKSLISSRNFGRLAWERLSWWALLDDRESEHCARRCCGVGVKFEHINCCVDPNFMSGPFSDNIQLRMRQKKFNRLRLQQTLFSTLCHLLSPLLSHVCTQFWILALLGKSKACVLPQLWSRTPLIPNHISSNFLADQPQDDDSPTLYWCPHSSTQIFCLCLSRSEVLSC